MFLKTNRMVIDVMTVHRTDLWRDRRDLTRNNRARLARDVTAA